MRAIIYCRKSTDRDDKQALSLPAQRDVCQRIAQEKGFEVVEVIEESMSAKAPGRPQFARMMNLFHKGKADVLITYHLNRLARNPIDGGTVQYALQSSVIRAVHTSEGAFHPEDNALIMSMYFGMSAQFVRELRAATMRGMKKKVENGGIVCKAPYGYRQSGGTIFVDPDEAVVVRRMMQLRTRGMTYADIAQELSEAGLTRRGVPWGHSSVDRVIRDRFYIGFARWMGEEYRHSAPTIIDDTLFQSAARVGKRGVKYEHIDQYPLKGMLYQWRGNTENISQPLLPTTVTGRHGGKYVYYRTPPRVEKSESVYIREAVVFSRFEEYLSHIHVSAEVMDDLVAALTEEHQRVSSKGTARRSQLSAQITRVKGERANLTLMRMRGEIDEEEFRSIKKDIQRRESEYSEEMKRGDAFDQNFQEKLALFCATLRNPLQEWKTLSLSQKVAFMKMASVQLFFDNKKSLIVAESEVFTALREGYEGALVPHPYTKSNLSQERIERLYRGLCAISIETFRTIAQKL